MKKLAIIGLLFTLVSCGEEYMQIVETKSTNTKEENNYYVYENETVKVTYQFWHDQGLMAFSVYNKMDAPLYIDWSKSAVIYNSSKVNYWAGNCWSSCTYYNKNTYKGEIEAPGYNISEDVGVRNSVRAAKMEKMTFIPPKSTYYRSQFRLMSEEFLPVDKTKFDLVTSNEDGKSKTKVYSANYDYNNSPLKVRNFLALSKNENSENNMWVDNEFYVAGVKSMYIGHVLGKNTKKTDSAGDNIYELSSKKNTSFYIIHYDVTRVAGLKNDKLPAKY